MQKDLIQMLKSGKIGIYPTDTLYGLVGSALSKKTVTRIYAAKKRTPVKACIILISSIKTLALFDISLTSFQKKQLQLYWPGKVTVILSLNKEGISRYKYLHRGTNTLAFRLPKQESLRKLLKKTGPLIAPSANSEGMPPASNIKQAQEYFGDNVDFYVSGRVSKKASKIISLTDDKVTIIRK